MAGDAKQTAMVLQLWKFGFNSQAEQEKSLCNSSLNLQRSPVTESSPLHQPLALLALCPHLPFDVVPLNSGAHRNPERLASRALKDKKALVIRKVTPRLWARTSPLPRAASNQGGAWPGGGALFSRRVGAPVTPPPAPYKGACTRDAILAPGQRRASLLTGHKEVRGHSECRLESRCKSEPWAWPSTVSQWDNSVNCGLHAPGRFREGCSYGDWAAPNFFKRNLTREPSKLSIGSVAKLHLAQAPRSSCGVFASVLRCHLSNNPVLLFTERKKKNCKKNKRKKRLCALFLLSEMSVQNQPNCDLPWGVLSHRPTRARMKAFSAIAGKLIHHFPDSQLGSG